MLIPYNRLSEEQKDIIKRISREENTDLMVEGPAGSGKTLISLHTLDSLVKDRNLKPLILIYNHSLYGYLISVMNQMELTDNITIATKDKFFKDMGVAKGAQWVWESSFESNYNEVMRVLSAAQLDPQYDITIVDEVQDFTPQEWSLVKRISKNIISLGDFKQGLYSTGLKREQVRGDGREEKLTKIFRYHKNIAKLAQPFTDMNLESLVVRIEATQPIIMDVSDDNEFLEIGNILENLKNHRKRTGIIAPSNSSLKQLATYLKFNDIEHIYFDKNKQFRNHDFDSNLPVLITSYSSKGLEFENVILFGFNEDDSSIRNMRMKNNLSNILYVNITRTNTNLYIIRTPNTIKELKELKVEQSENVSSGGADWLDDLF